MNAEVIASITTAAGTLVLAVATFFSTQSANRASRAAERGLLDGLRPVLMHARIDDPAQKVGFIDGQWFRVQGSGAIVQEGDSAIYLVIAVRNVGSGIAVLQGWDPQPERIIVDPHLAHSPVESFRMLTRDIYVAPGDVGFWQGAIRDRDDPLFASFAQAAKDRTPVTIDVLYTDLHGGQRAITRFSVVAGLEDHWMSAAGRHWILDGDSPR